MAGEVRMRFYGELNDLLAPERRFTSSAFAFVVPTTAGDAIESLGVPHTEVELVLVNGESAPLSRAIADGDRISVYPVFEALDITPLLRVRPEPLRHPRFALDVHLGRLAAYLRMLGFDTLYRNDWDDAALARVAAEERRILLTRDRGLLKRSIVTRGHSMRATSPRAQLSEVLERFDLAASAAPFTRCLACNGALEPAAKQDVEAALPPRVRAEFEDFLRCSGCGRVYWKGSHYRRMERLVEESLKSAGNALK